jgi:hypothetical protein
MSMAYLSRLLCASPLPFYTRRSYQYTCQSVYRPTIGPVRASIGQIEFW